MDEGGGCLVIGVIALVVIGAILFALGWVFVTLSHLVGHAAVLVVILAALGACIGLFRHTSRNPVQAVSDDDYAVIAGIRMMPAQWASAVLISFIAIVALYGMVVI